MPGVQAGRQHHHRRRAALRRLPGAARADDDRHADRVPAVSADVLRADAGDLAVLQHVPVGAVGAGEAGGRAGRAAGHPGPGASGAAADRCAATSLSDDVRLLVRARPPGASGSEPDRARGADRRARRDHRRGQDDHRQADRPVLRPDVGFGDARRRRPSRLSAGRAAPPRRDGHAGELHVRRHRRRQHPLRPARCDRRRGARGGRGGRRGPVHRRAARRATTPTWPSAAAGCPRASVS